MGEEKSIEIKKEVENAKQEVAKGEYDCGIWQLFIPLLLMAPYCRQKRRCSERRKTRSVDMESR